MVCTILGIGNTGTDKDFALLERNSANSYSSKCTEDNKKVADIWLVGSGQRKQSIKETESIHVSIWIRHQVSKPRTLHKRPG